MAAEPEKRIEESLHAYARKRREEAGAPMEMHPATRRMLQGEVAKLKAAQPPERRAWWQSFFPVWPRLAAAVGMFAVLAVGVWVFTQSEGQRANEVGQVAQRAAESQELDDFARSKDVAKAEKESDRIAPSASTAEEAGKKLAKRPGYRALDESKVQLRDAEKAPAAPAATPPPVMLSDVAPDKEVALRYDAPAQQEMKLKETLVTSTTGDKSGDANSALLKQRAESTRSFRFQDGRFVQNAVPTATESFSVSPTSALPSALTLAAANKPADNYAFQPPPSNVIGSLGDARQRLNLEVTNVFLGFDVATYTAGGVLAAASGPATPGTESAAARAELSRARGVQLATGVEATLGQKFERQDGTAVTALLQKFELQQHANGRISIRDADGTVYEGELLAAKADSDTAVKAKAENESREANRKLARNDNALAVAALTSVSFRASGTNRNKELVVINGEMLREEDQLGRIVTLADKNVVDLAAAAAAPTTAPAPSEPTLRAQAQGGAANTRAPARFAERVSGVNTSAAVFMPTAIRGRVQIGKTNQQELRAIRSR
jgi:hypothetical protein